MCDPKGKLPEGKGMILVISGPSGVGKGTLRERLLKRFPSMRRSISVTTRRPRPGEVHGRDYFFVSREEFQRMIGEGKFLEWAWVFDELYGTPAGWVEEQLSSGVDVLLEIDVQGAFQVKEKKPDAVLVFIAPPSWEELERRLRKRHTEDEEEVRRRLKVARREVEMAPRYDYVVVNDDLDQAAYELECIVVAEKCRAFRRRWGVRGDGGS
ncbi:MAG TPA: guanylate kinase [Armatimonadetes bacterium]|nr:guanylate kinase [Armatimonadota bacterium]